MTFFNFKHEIANFILHYPSNFFINIFKYCPFYFSALFLSNKREKISSKLIQRILIIGTILYPFSFFLYSMGNEQQFVSKIIQTIGINNSLIFTGIKAAVSVYNTYVMGFLGICFFWFICKKTYYLVNARYGKPLFIQRYLCLVSMYSLPVYILHIFFLKPGVLYPAVSFLCGITVPVIIGMIAKRIKYVREILFGL